MRYQYFLARLRNREWKAVLSMTMVNAIPHAVAGLLYKNMHLPAAHDDDFADMEANPKSDSALMEEKMMTLMEQTQGLLLQQQQATRATTSGGTSYNAAAYDIQVGQSVPPTSVPMSTGNVVTHQPIAVESLVVGTALLVGTVGPSDTTVECTLPKQSGSGQPSGGCGGRQGSRACYMSRGTDHLVAVCPVKAGLNQFIAQGGNASTPAQVQAQPSQQ
ncbi:hypothetical protein PC128_g24156 [Phytophthora cactorum]|nr:hypothetical protein PC128_g24156 [Phytophthora cactorum]